MNYPNPKQQAKGKKPQTRMPSGILVVHIDIMRDPTFFTSADRYLKWQFPPASKPLFCIISPLPAVAAQVSCQSLCPVNLCIGQPSNIARRFFRLPHKASQLHMDLLIFW